MVGIAAVLVLISLSIVITRIGATALQVTGVSHDLAHFQSRSAFTGVGYTTSEAERIAQHPVRRRIVGVLMLLGNAGIVSVVASLVLGFSGASLRQALGRLGVLVLGLLLLWWLTSTERFNLWAQRVIERAVSRLTTLEVRDYVHLLHLSGEYAVRELAVDADDEWLLHASLDELDLPGEGLLVLGVRRADGRYVGAPPGDVELRDGDTLVLYGRREAIADLSNRQSRREGERAHDQAVAEQQRVEERERAEDRADDADTRAGAT